MALLDEVLVSNSDTQINEGFFQILRALPMGAKIELSVIAATLLSGFIKSTIKKYRTNNSEGSEYKVYSFDFGNITPEQIINIGSILKEITKQFKANSEVIDSRYKVTERNGKIYAVIINVLIMGYNILKYKRTINDPTINKFFDFESSEVDSGRIYDTESEPVSDEQKQLSEGLVQLLWPVVKTAAAIYAGKIIFNKITDMIDRAPVKYGKYVTFGWEFDADKVNINQLEKLFNEITLEIEYYDRADVIKDTETEVFRSNDKNVVYLLLAAENNYGLKRANNVLDRVSKKYNIDFVEIKRGIIQ